ncbi:MAG: hypothetical protein AAF846_16260 [Chloroflexota bacterium]
MTLKPASKTTPSLQFVKTVEAHYTHITSLEDALTILKNAKLDEDPYYMKLYFNTEKISADMVRFQAGIDFEKQVGQFTTSNIYLTGELHMADGLLLTLRAGVTNAYQSLIQGLLCGLVAIAMMLSCVISFYPLSLSTLWLYISVLIVGSTIGGMIGLLFLAPRNDALRALQSIFEEAKS